MSTFSIKGHPMLKFESMANARTQIQTQNLKLIGKVWNTNVMYDDSYNRLLDRTFLVEGFPRFWAWDIRLRCGGHRVQL